MYNIIRVFDIWQNKTVVVGLATVHFPVVSSHPQHMRQLHVNQRKCFPKINQLIDGPQCNLHVAYDVRHSAMSAPGTPPSGILSILCKAPRCFSLDSGNGEDHMIDVYVYIYTHIYIYNALFTIMYLQHVTTIPLYWYIYIYIFICIEYIYIYIYTQIYIYIHIVAC